MLGPLQVLRGGVLLDLGPRQRRVLLIRLLIEDGRPVSLTELSKSLWQSDRPTAAVSSIRAHVSRLRAVLEPTRDGRPTVLTNGPAGYSLHVSQESRDTHMFERSVTRAREALSMGRLLQARRDVESALALWRGTALGEASDHDFAQHEKRRLSSARQDAKELRTTVLIHQGNREHAVHAAEELVATAPLREGSWSLLMRALYAAGRPVDALRQYERFRGMLAQELGLDPSPALRDIHTAVLRHDMAILGLAQPDRVVTAPSQPSRPAPMPFVGRALELAELTDFLQVAATMRRTRWAVVSGEQGIGKSRLLEELAMRASSLGFTVAKPDHGQEPADDGADLKCPALRLLEIQVGHGSDAAVADIIGRQPLTASVEEAGRPAMLWVVDDLDRTTPEMHDAVRRFATALPHAPLAIVCGVGDTQRASVGNLLAELARLDTTWVHLSPLDNDDVAELLSIRREDASPDQVTALHRRSAGNPFLLSELLKLPPWQRTGSAAVVPAAVCSIIQAKVAAVPSPVKMILNYAAADGGRLDIDLVARIQGVHRERLLTLIDVAVTADLLVWQADHKSAMNGFYEVPELVADALLDAMTPSSRQLLHAAFARTLTDLPGIDPERLAGHLDAAGPMAPLTVPHSAQPSYEDRSG
ncbi:BTAD domain-containing putative transcriptional regulator [Streptomyces asoensis]|uniref:BTAD domain-containing putative transcriptional regulator n=1 Tax=Streptomyces asoensis TaxID=249586 RepID=UPI0033FBDF5E